MQYSVQSKILMLALIIGIIQYGGFNIQAESITSSPSSIDLTGPDYRLKGPGRILTIKGYLKSSTGCKVNYSRFKPHTSESAFIVVLGRGFLRSRQRMETKARHFASWGIDPSASNWWSVDGHNFKTMVEASYITPVERD